MKTTTIYQNIRVLLAIFLVFNACSKDPSLPEGSMFAATITTLDPTDINRNSAVSGGTIEADGIKDISARGVCWSTNPNPTINDNFTRNGSGTGTFKSEMKNLSPGTTYFVRAYLENSLGVIYGNEKQFSTPAILQATLNTLAITEISHNSAQTGGNVLDAGGGQISGRGICWSTSENPTINDSKTVNGTGTGEFTSKLTQLNPETTYYVRAYATNETGTVYGNQQQFKTLSISLPIVTTLPIVDIERRSAKSGGTVTNTTDFVFERGVCWSTQPNPNINDSRSKDGVGTGTFNSNLRDLRSSTTYYVRAYARTAAGVVYGNELQFQTKSDGGGRDDDDDD